MKLVSGTQVKDELHALGPRQVAVAYVGRDWEQFVSTATLREIVVSPTAGSNADAIADLVRALRWENVHFLDELHAKLYIGPSAAAVGSFNLSMNGLSGEALQEAGYVVDAPAALEELGRLYERYKSRAQERYPSQKDKEKQLSRLREINSRLAEALPRTGSQNESRRLADFIPVTDRDFYCCYYESEGADFDVAALQRQQPDKFTAVVDDPASLMARYLPFLEKDDVQAGHWVLMWKAEAGGSIPDKLDVEWMFIHRVFPKGAKDEHHGYTTLAVQWKGARRVGAPPFKLGAAEKTALRKLLASGEFREFLPPQDGRPWSLNKTFQHFKQFVEKLRSMAAEGTGPGRK
ncbi:hypothetical protein GPY61_18185 [Massilia sp. NEAU-DD11]|uniref:Phospholipase D-like domain-containing protein n=1 Tax=Massilia cellulosiltytica TaxID=2683234 RepID=A0A7X3K8U7_9BURK|nr:phospholipase D family protein [Telluria cellulosilytica]MVW61862.1 hypothetical protein [Telluria cellulosilytica]